ncbi:MAG: hypothetical protein U0441_09715 [Polyangiaceae bacterium]
MVRKVFVSAVLMTVLGVFAAACGGGYSESKATERCDQEQSSKSFCVTDKVYDACMSCYEECGDQCLPQNTCPEAYACKN